ncbi:hypothetical protein GCM10029964_122960 [Kibdelosporangium lantanae]
MRSTAISSATPVDARWAISAVSPAATRGARHAARPPSTRPRATASMVALGSSTSSGPSWPRANLIANSAATTQPMIANDVVMPDPWSSSPKTLRSAMAHPPPTTAMIEPAVTATELAWMMFLPGTTCGRDADSPDPVNRVTPRTSSDSRNRILLLTLASSPTVAMRTSAPRNRLATTSTRRRSHRSSRAPANGPTTEYGSNRAVNPVAMVSGSAPVRG